MATFPKMAESWRIARLDPAKHIAHCVLDTDTYNEVDDQFALTYAFLAKESLELEAVYAAPFHNSRSTGPEDGMVKSYEEIHRVLERLGGVPKGFVFEGSRKWLKDSDGPVESPAAQDLIKRAMARPDDAEPLYVLTIGAPTNVASALLMEPELVKKIVVVWLGGQPLEWPTAKEFNLFQDVKSSQVLFDSGVPLMQVPCTNVAEHLRVSLPFLDAYLKGKSAIGDYLTEIVHHYTNDPFCWSKVIWDISTVAWIVNAGWFNTTLTQSPVLHDDFRYSHDANRHLFRVATHLSRDVIFRDLFNKIGAFGK
ncbi:MAG: nucleoside hydrolase [Victivallales bacterium]|jgi:inosine-uridine nucleoside N-ribohydrolase|nr:nucleoside hydrolase [Victivallales bacterium]MBR3650524.1 nucleoside hydrolase [Victivallales bacterium]